MGVETRIAQFSFSFCPMRQILFESLGISTPAIRHVLVTRKIVIEAPCNEYQ